MPFIQRTLLATAALFISGCAAPVDDPQPNSSNPASLPVNQSPEEQAAIDQIKSLGGRVLYTAMGSKEYSVALNKDSFGKSKGFTVANAALLGELKNAIEISLQNPDANDAWIASMGNLNGLKKLHLEKTKVTDQSLDIIGKLTGLEYLNLYGTAISDAGLDKLKGLKNLKNLYLWQTKVTEAKAKAFQAAMAEAGNKDLSINLGVGKDFRSVNTLARLAQARAASETAARETAAKAAQAEAERIAAIKTPLFEKDILPIFQKRCTECHGKEKQKGKLRLDSFAELAKGADGEPVFTAGKPAESGLHQRIVLPDSDDDRMPPKGNRISEPVAELIKRWIEQGAKQK